jgi:hypothetical protein
LLATGIDIATEEIARNEGIPWTSTTMATLRNEAEEEEHLGLPFDDDAYL